MNIYIHKSHNVSVLVYHLVCPAKYRRAVNDETVDMVIKDICLEMAKRYQVHFLEIGTDKDHIHFLIQSVSVYSPTKIAALVKSITARKVFERVPEVKKQLWGGEFWTDGYFMNTVGRQNSESAVREYIKNQGKEKEYRQLHQDQLTLF